MDDNLYKKQGRKYLPVSKYEFNGFPSDGIWLVQYKPHAKLSSCIMKMGEVPAFNLNKRVNLETKRDELLDVMRENSALSNNDLLTEIFKTLSE